MGRGEIGDDCPAIPAMRISPNVHTATVAAYISVELAAEVSPKPIPATAIPAASTLA